MGGPDSLDRKVGRKGVLMAKTDIRFGYNQTYGNYLKEEQTYLLSERFVIEYICGSDEPGGYYHEEADEVC